MLIASCPHFCCYIVRAWLSSGFFFLLNLNELLTFKSCNISHKNSECPASLKNVRSGNLESLGSDLLLNLPGPYLPSLGSLLWDIYSARVYSLPVKTMLKYHSSIFARTLELNTISFPSMTTVWKIKKSHMTQSSLLSPHAGLFLSHNLPSSPLQGHWSQFLQVRTMWNVPLSLFIPYKTVAMAKKSIWCSDVPGSCSKAPREEADEQSILDGPCPPHRKWQ